MSQWHLLHGYNYFSYDLFAIETSTVMQDELKLTLPLYLCLQTHLCVHFLFWLQIMYIKLLTPYPLLLIQWLSLLLVLWLFRWNDELLFLFEFLLLREI